MSDLIDQLNDRDDVAKTEYVRYEADTNDEIEIEMWHDSEGLQRIMERAINGVSSEKGLRKFAEEEAIVIRKTRSETFPDLEELYDS
jgi:hypothetical protein